MINFPLSGLTNTRSYPLALAKEKPSISVVGLGYVGAVSTACLSSLGHRVVGVDIDKSKVSLIGAGRSPIHEEDLGDYLAEGVSEGLISTTTDLAQAVAETDITFVSVGTPTAMDGGCDQTYIEAAAKAIGQGLKRKQRFHIIVMRCSVPPGLTMNMLTPIIEQVSGLSVGKDFGVCFNPEFLREGMAIADFHTPSKTVIGASDRRTAKTVAKIFLPVDPNPIFTSVEVAEAIKYADNVWHATKVCFANEVGRLCKAVGVDGHAVMDVFVQDKKLNLSSYYLKPGFAYGGSCLPKEVRAINHIARINGLELPLFSSLEKSNSVQIETATNMVLKTGAKRVAVLGLAFKAGTDDLRESPILKVIAALREKNIKVTAHDTAVRISLQNQMASNQLGHGSDDVPVAGNSLSSMLRGSISDTLKGVDAVIVTHNSAAYREALTNADHLSVIDVVRLFDDPPRQQKYQGIGW